jgi:hypothetical protein
MSSVCKIQLCCLPPSQTAIRPSTFIGGTSLISSIGDFLLVSCNKHNEQRKQIRTRLVFIKGKIQQL